MAKETASTTGVEDGGPTTVQTSAVISKPEGVHAHEDGFLVVFKQGEQEIHKTFDSEKKARTWYEGVLELRQENKLEPVLKGVNAAVKSTSRTVKAYKALNSAPSLQVGENFP